MKSCVDVEPVVVDYCMYSKWQLFFTVYSELSSGRLPTVSKCTSLLFASFIACTALQIVCANRVAITAWARSKSTDKLDSCTYPPTYIGSVKQNYSPNNLQMLLANGDQNNVMHYHPYGNSVQRARRVRTVMGTSFKEKYKGFKKRKDSLSVSESY